MDAIPFSKNERLHLRVPPLGLVAKVNSRFQQQLHRDDSHDYSLVPVLWHSPTIRSPAITASAPFTPWLAPGPPFRGTHSDRTSGPET